MSVAERDPYTGHMTTGHEWNGIKELNTPVPTVLLFFLFATILFAIAYWYLMPAWPLGDDYTRGSLGIDQRKTISTQLADARAEQAGWTSKLEAASFDDITADENLMQIVRESGPALFRDNCSMCHGSKGQGGPTFPNLTDAAWLWGNDPESILMTLQVGINADHPNTRVAQMPAFGKTGALDNDTARGVVAYLRSLSDPSIGNGTRAAELVAVNKGARTYATICVACHGANGQGNPALGAPNLVDAFWLYGNDKKSLFDTIWNGRGGHMPAWESRLTLAQRKILTLHVLSFSESGTDDVNVTAAN